jgi:hypothetical protein
MGTLVGRHELDDKAKWYFLDAYYCSDSRKYRYNWPSLDFAHHVHIHNDKYTLTPIPFVKIRKWIESNIIETVIYDEVDLSYRRYTDHDQTWERSYEVTNKWHRFSFSTAESALMFSLVFSECVRPLSKHSPSWPEHEDIFNKEAE